MSTSLVSLASLVSAYNPVVPQLRVAALITRQDELLLVEHRKQAHPYWVLPGGRVQGGETLEAALRRELREELGLALEVGRLVIVSEMLAPERHVVSLIFEARVGEGVEPRLDPADPVLAGWQWVAVSRLPRMDFRPPIADAIRRVIAQDFRGPVELLGDSWRPEERRPRR